MSTWGHWVIETNAKVFSNKREALLWASQNGDPKVRFIWHNHVWETYDRSRLGSISLSELYRQRAQQLRDSYDHLTLYYSGGADSHNILVTFIKNNIKLDHVYVNWPKSIVGTSLYVPNTRDASASNILSEWDYAIAPTLHWLAQNRPDIEIEIGDWAACLDEKYYKDDTFLSSPQWWGVGSLPRNLNRSARGQALVEKGLKVASIYGFDKPHLYTWGEEKNVGMFFHDTAFMTASNYVGHFEPFYWSPNLPDLPFEMAHQMFLYFDAHPEHRRYLRQIPLQESIEVVNEFNNDITRYICYRDTWPFGRFQAGKPWDGKRKDRDSWIYDNHQFDRIVQAWQYNYDGFLQGISSTYFNDFGNLNPLRTKAFRLGRFDANKIIS